MKTEHTFRIVFYSVSAFVIAGLLYLALPEPKRRSIDAWFGIESSSSGGSNPNGKKRNFHFTEPVDSFSEKRLPDILRELREQGFKVSCRGKLFADEKFSHHNDQVCWAPLETFANNIPATTVTFFFAKNRTIGVNLDFPMSSYEAVQDYVERNFDDSKRAYKSRRMKQKEGRWKIWKMKNGLVFTNGNNDGKRLNLWWGNEEVYEMERYHTIAEINADKDTTNEEESSIQKHFALPKRKEVLASIAKYSDNRSCELRDVASPQSLKVLAGGGYRGRSLGYTIDKSGHEATMFRVVVNEPGKSVGLILGAYDPSVWVIGRTAGTTVSAVVVTGYHSQTVLGVSGETEVIHSSHDNKGGCGYLYITPKKLQKVNPFSHKIFGKRVDSVNYAEKGEIIFGEKIGQGEKIMFTENTPANLDSSNEVPLSGLLAIQDLVKQGSLRAATKSDMDHWAQKMADKYRHSLPSVASGKLKETFSLGDPFRFYVIVKEVIIPDGLYGGNSVSFFLSEGVPFPSGDLGHCELYDLNDMVCYNSRGEFDCIRE